MAVFDEYLAGLTDQFQRDRTAEVLVWVGRTYPRLEARIAWKQPMFTDHGTFIIGFSVSRFHLAASPERETMIRFADEITRAGFEHSTMLVRFPWSKPIDYGLLARLIDFNIADKADLTSFWRP